MLAPPSPTFAPRARKDGAPVFRLQAYASAKKENQAEGIALAVQHFAVAFYDTADGEGFFSGAFQDGLGFLEFF